MVDKNYPTLVRFGVSITGTKELGSDLVSETYIDIQSRDKDVPCSGPEFCRYFYRYMKFISMKTYHAFYRATHSNESLPEFLNDVEEGEEQSKDELFERIDKFKSTLDDLDKTLFELTYEKSHSYRKIVYLYNTKYKTKMTIQGIYCLMKPLKQKIKEYKWQD